MRFNSDLNIAMKGPRPSSPVSRLLSPSPVSRLLSFVSRLASLVLCLISSLPSFAAQPQLFHARPGRAPAGCVYAAKAFVSVAPGVSAAGRVGKETCALVSSEVGFSYARAVPQYRVGESVKPPDNVDWDLTFAAYQKSLPADSADVHYLFDPADKIVFPTRIGANPFVWVTTNETGTATSVTNTYVIGTSTKERPLRLYWTDTEYKYSPVDFGDRFVKIYGNPRVMYGSNTVMSSGTRITDTNAVVSGVYLDSNKLYCMGARQGLSGQFVIAYYDSGSYKDVLSVHLVEILKPEPRNLKGTVGQPLKPHGDGYPTEGLVPYPTSAGVSEPIDGRGAYLYQHRAEHAYAPMDGLVFPLRPCAHQNAQVWWKEADDMGVEWPFELTQYDCAWPADMPVFVRPGKTRSFARSGVAGEAPLRIPSAYTAELMKYQDPPDHARGLDASRPGLFFTDVVGTNGLALVRLTAGDDVWFLPVRSVPRDDTNLFTRTASEWNVGEPLRPRGGGLDGLAPGVDLPVDASEPAYLWRDAASDLLPYATRLYADVSSCDAPATAADGYPSEIVPVHTNANIEAWWGRTWRAEGMDFPVAMPSVVQVYAPRWPQPDEVPQIVLASGEGSAATSVWRQTGALVFGEADTRVALEVRPRLRGAEGTLEFWTRPMDLAPDASGQLLTLRADAAGSCEVRFTTHADRLELTWSRPEQTVTTNRLAGRDVVVRVSTNAVQSFAGAYSGASDTWHHVSLTLGADASGARRAAFALDGAVAAAFPLSAPELVADGFTHAFLGADGGRAAAPAGAEIGEIRVWNDPISNAWETSARRLPSAGASGLFEYLSFREGEDLTPNGKGPRTCRERVRGVTLEGISGAYLRTPGPPAESTGVLDADGTPFVYAGNDVSAPGYNPNEEHAFVTAGALGHVVWALRDDLNRAGESEPLVLCAYPKAGRMRMQAYRVVETNERHRAFAGPGTVGEVVPGPSPFDLLSPPDMAETYWISGNGLPQSSPVYRDRTGRLWFRCAGEARVCKYYPMSEGFFIPGKSLAEQPAVGTPLPWLACRTCDAKDVAGEALGGTPAPWTWTASWPDPASRPAMKIGQTLHRAADGLAEVWNCSSLAVVYPDPATGEADGRVTLFDPTVQRSVRVTMAELNDYGFTLGQKGNLTQRGSKVYFQGLAPSISDRVWFDTERDEIVFAGRLDEPAGGTTVLYVNVLSPDEQASLAAACPVDAKRDAWARSVVSNLVGAAAAKSVNAYRWDAFPEADGLQDLRVDYEPVDHYALSAMGTTGWVVMVENDGPTTGTNRMVNPGDPVTMRVFRVVPEYYAGRTVVREDPYNLLSQQLNVRYTEPFAGRPDDFEFEWRRAYPTASGLAPADYAGADWQAYPAAGGRPSFTLGEKGSALSELVNRYYVCRYRMRPESPCYTNLPASLKGQWSRWCEPPALAEGWVQRVLNNVTPFTQRMTDLYNNRAETVASMIAQAGAPWEGNVALNQDNLTSVGLVQLYQTLLNVAESMSVMGSAQEAPVCEQLMLAAERLDDLYAVLGDEAFSDAMNPTVGFGTTFALSGAALGVDYGALSSSLFCFDNQVPTLLDEELALLRGRSGASAPSTRVSPFYNRLVWNFTRGITAGEVAYAVNYDTGIADGASASAATKGITANDAAAAYPQGHGDAYGHYLTGLKGWYRLLRNPNFSWVRAAGAMNVTDAAATSVDYYEEAKLAGSAANVAKAAAEIVDRTARQAWRDNGGSCGTGYLDANPTNAFGYGEWGVRGGYGALVNWAAANALLPEDASRREGDGIWTERGQDRDLARIDRGTVAELAAICAHAAAIQGKVDAMDLGLNPLGLSENAVPFDITPIAAGDAGRTHYEQVRERAGTALRNAQKVLDRAQESANRLRQVRELEAALTDEQAEEEEDWDAELVSIFGKPYPADVGPTGTYAQGYDGPDYYHYMWMDLSKYGVSQQDQCVATNVVLDFNNLYTLAARVYSDDVARLVKDMTDGLGVNDVISWQFSSSGLIVPDNGKLDSPRPVNGEIQVAYGELLVAYEKTVGGIDLLLRRKQDFARILDVITERVLKSSGNKTNMVAKIEDVREKTVDKARVDMGLGITKGVLSTAGVGAEGYMDWVLSGVEFIQAAERIEVNGPIWGSLLAAAAAANPLPGGVAVGGAILASVAIQQAREAENTTRTGLAFAASTVSYIGQIAASVVSSVADTVNAAVVDGLGREQAWNQQRLAECQAAWSERSEMYGLFNDAQSAMNAYYAAGRDARNALIDLQAATERISSVVSKGTKLMEKRAAARRRAVSKAAKLRYSDMFFRLERDAALARYSTSFDLAQKYAFLAAKAYDYETGFLKADPRSGDAFLAEITGSRSLGQLTDGEPVLADMGDTGLAGILARLDANWRVVKPQLGLDSPQPYATWFSLRSELMRILPGAEGDRAWRDALRLRRVDDLRTLPEFRRLCRPFESETGSLAAKEPGLVIEFASTIDFAKNFFGNDLVNEGSSFNSSWFATKIDKAGVFFENYNAKLNGYGGKAQLAEDPTVYLVPVGTDRMRAPGQDDGASLEWNVLDQVIPAPYAIGADDLAAADWFPADDGDTGTADGAVRVRRYPSFRAHTGPVPTDAMLDAPRLAGRSVWNSRWMLIIPAGALNADRDAALKYFIDGGDENRDGTSDLSGVTDIKIGFKTYSHAGR